MAILIKSALLIVNPASRRGDRVASEALAAFRLASVRVDCFFTEQPGHGGQIASRLADRYDATFTLGGDGTADEVIGALAGSGIPVGILPGGTGNLLARALGTPISVRRAVAALVNGVPRKVDLGLINGERYYAFALGIGIDARMMEIASRGMKRTLGVAAYGVAAVRLSLFRESFDVTVNVDGEVLSRNASMVMVANFGSVLSDLILLGPGIQSDDGLLDVCVLSPRSALDAVRVFWKMLRKDFSPDPCMEFRAGRVVVLDAVPPSRVQADGELLGVTPVRVEVQPLRGTLLTVR